MGKKKPRATKKGLFKRKINGKNYWGGPWYSKKTDAKELAARLRKSGDCAIVIDSTYRGKKGYRVLNRHK